VICHPAGLASDATAACSPAANPAWLWLPLATPILSLAAIRYDADPRNPGLTKRYPIRAQGGLPFRRRAVSYLYAVDGVDLSIMPAKAVGLVVNRAAANPRWRG